MSGNSAEGSYNIRLCHIVKWDTFVGYGFNLHAEKGKPGQYIGKVDEGSPAEAAGLKEGDRIIEVNGVNISNENHKQVVQRIKNILNETKLLVVDKETDNYFKQKNIVIKGTLPNVKYIKTPDNWTETDNAITNGNSDYAHSQLSGSSESEFYPSNARLCHVVKCNGFDGFGFNLHAEKGGKFGQFVGKVDKGSPAEAAGLKEGDRIIEVNGINIANESHKQVVARIKRIPNETKLLVIDEKTDLDYRRSVVKSNSNVIRDSNSDSKQNAPANGADSSDDSYSQNSTRSATYPQWNESIEKTSPPDSVPATPSTDRTTSAPTASIEHSPQSIEKTSPPDSAPATPSSNRTTSAPFGSAEYSSDVVIDSQVEKEKENGVQQQQLEEDSKSETDGGSKLNLNMTAKELREILAKKKKYDPKKESLDIKKKFEIVQKL